MQTEPQVALDPFIRDRGLEAVGESIYVGVSPDLYDGQSDAEFRAMESTAPRFFDSWIGRHVGLPQGFDRHYRDEVLPDMRTIRDHPELREGFRAELDALLRDENRIRNLYTPGGETYSEMLRKWASKVEPVQSGVIRRPRQRKGRNK